MLKQGNCGLHVSLCSAHSRNESTDSGLSVSSLPRTTDHMLSSVEHMDTGNVPKHTTSMTQKHRLGFLWWGNEAFD